VKDQRGPALRALDATSRPRGLWSGTHSDLPGVTWWFEAVLDVDDVWIVVRHLECWPEGRTLRYSVDHLEDDDGFLTDQPLDPTWDGVEEVSAEAFRSAWKTA
jgi:hypothetical protein